MIISLLSLEIQSVWIETKRGELASLRIFDQEFSRGLRWVSVNGFIVDLPLGVNLFLVLLDHHLGLVTVYITSKARLLLSKISKLRTSC